jgi:hypothetical protein
VHNLHNQNARFQHFDFHVSEHASWKSVQIRKWGLKRPLWVERLAAPTTLGEFVGVGSLLCAVPRRPAPPAGGKQGGGEHLASGFTAV